MKPLRTAGDGAKAAKDHLAGVVPALVGDPAPTFGLGLPDDWTPKSAPAVVVFDDNGPVIPFVADQPRLRVTVWSDGRTTARRIAGVCRGVLLAHRIEGIGAVSEPTGLGESRDSRTGGLMCSFTVAVTVRTVAL